jgi:hypothetical protein
MDCTPVIRRYQKEWFNNLRRRVIEGGEPYVIAPAVSAHEILESFDMPYVCSEWWSGLTAARRQSADYLDLLEEHGYHDGLPRYGALVLATALDGDNPRRPWGGLPKPAFVMYQGQNGPTARWENVAEAFGVPAIIANLTPDSSRLHHHWWDVSKWMWEDLYGTERIDCIVEGYRQIIAQCERVSGKRFDIDKLREVMNRANAQEDAFGEARQVMRKAPKVPVNLAEELGNVMTIQWHRGSQWALDAARMYRDEVIDRAARGVAVCPDERIRLAWGGLGLWQNVQFYRAFEASHQAVFVRSIYMSIAIDGYTRYGTRDPLRALAARYAGISMEIVSPPANVEWAVHELKEYRADGAVILPDDTKFMPMALERAGIPTMVIPVDPVDGRTWNEEKLIGMVSRFIEERVAKEAAG